MEVVKAQFYHSVRIAGREHQTVMAGQNGLSPELKLYYENSLIVVDEPTEENIIIVGMTNTRHFQVSRKSIGLDPEYVKQQEEMAAGIYQEQEGEVSFVVDGQELPTQIEDIQTVQSAEPIDATEEVMAKVDALKKKKGKK